MNLFHGEQKKENIGNDGRPQTTYGSLNSTENFLDLNVIKRGSHYRVRNREEISPNLYYKGNQTCPICHRLFG